MNVLQKCGEEAAANGWLGAVAQACSHKQNQDCAYDEKAKNAKIEVREEVGWMRVSVKKVWRAERERVWAR